MAVLRRGGAHHFMSKPEFPAFDGKAFVKSLSTAPGVYRMIAADDSVLYVGKAGALKNRVVQLFQRDAESPRAS